MSHPTAVPVATALPAVRRQHGLRLLRTYGAVSCAQLRRLFNVSEATARRDIQDLVDRGYAARVHGGAVLPDPTTGFSANGDNVRMWCPVCNTRFNR